MFYFRNKPIPMGDEMKFKMPSILNMTAKEKAEKIVRVREKAERRWIELRNEEVMRDAEKRLAYLRRWQVKRESARASRYEEAFGRKYVPVDCDSLVEEVLVEKIWEVASEVIDQGGDKDEGNQGGHQDKNEGRVPGCIGALCWCKIV